MYGISKKTFHHTKKNCRKRWYQEDPIVICTKTLRKINNIICGDEKVGFGLDSFPYKRKEFWLEKRQKSNFQNNLI